MNKMFSSAEFVDEWNQIFSFKIKESDLGKPTEAFVFNALVNYLKMFNFDTGPMIQMKNSENLVERRNFLIRFCNYIDHIYKISDKSHYFVYYDLMHPAPKKTVHMLNHLLNYFFYFNMFKDSIVPVAYGKIRQRDESLDKINKMKFENEQIEIKNKMIENAIVDYRTMVPQTNAELNQLLDLEAAEKASIINMEEKLNNCNSMLESLRNKEMMLAMEIVSQEEVDRLMKSMDTLTKAIAEQEIVENSTYANNQERAATVMRVQTTMARIIAALDLIPKANLSAYKANILKYKELESKLTEVRQKKEELLQSHEKLIAEVKRLEEEVEAKVNELRDIKVAGRNEVNGMKVLSDSNDAMIQEHKLAIESLDKESEDLLALHIFIMTNASALVQLTIDCCAEPKDR